MSACNKEVADGHDCCPKPPKTEPDGQAQARRQFLADLMQAIQDGKSSEIKRLLEQAQFDLMNEDVEADPLKNARRIALAPKEPKGIESGLFLVDPPEITYIPPLAWAVFHNKPKATRFFLEKAGARVNNPSTDGRTALHTAVSKGNWEILRILVEEADADVNSPNFAGETPLYFSLYYEREDYFMYLASRPEAKLNALTTAGFSLLHMACAKGLCKAVEFLLERQPDLATTPSIYENVSPVYLAAVGGHLSIVQLMFSRVTIGVESFRASFSRDALFVIVSKKSPPYQQIFTMLVEKGLYGTEDNLGILAVEAVFHGNEAALRAILSQPNITSILNSVADPDGVPPLHLAAFHGHTSCVVLLAKAGIDLQRKARDGESALYYADLGGFEEIADYLREKGLDE